LGLLQAELAGELQPKVKKLIDIAYHNSERLVRLTNDILDIEKVESGKMALNMAPVELSTAVNQAIESNRAYVEQLGVSLVIKDDLSGAKVRADQDRLSQVLTNLISNAA